MATHLVLKRVQTVLSFSQLEEGASKPVVFGPTSAVSECPSHPLPLYVYSPTPPSKLKYRSFSAAYLVGIVPEEEDDRSLCRVDSSLSACSESMEESSDSEPLGVVPTFTSFAPGGSPQCGAHSGGLLDTVITALWDDCAAQGLFRYDLSGVETKKVPGELQLVVQLNEGRASKKRPTEFRIDEVCQPFDDSKFNFKKAYAREVLFQFEPAAPGQGSTLLEAAPCPASPNLVVINVSPIEYGHVLLVPRVMDCIPQLVDRSTVELALHFAKEADNRSFRVGYNSLGAYATINHLHFQGYYLDSPFPCELAASGPIQGVPGHHGCLRVARLVGYPVNAFVIDAEHGAAAGADTADVLAELADCVGRACVVLQRANVPHNLLISDGGRRVFVFPQCFAERHARGLIPEEVLATGVNPAAFELAGHLLLKRQEDYDEATQQGLSALLHQASLPEHAFVQLAHMCFGPKSGGK